MWGKQDFTPRCAVPSTEKWRNHHDTSDSAFYTETRPNVLQAWVWFCCEDIFNHPKITQNSAIHRLCIATCLVITKKTCCERNSTEPLSGHEQKFKKWRAHELICRAHELICRAHELLCRAHELICRAHGLLCRAHAKIFFISLVYHKVVRTT